MIVVNLSIQSDEEDFLANIRAAVQIVARATKGTTTRWILAQTCPAVTFRKGQSAVGGYIHRTSSGGAEGVFAPSSDPLMEHVREKLSEQCCETNCLSAFNVDEVYQFQLNLLDMSKEQKSFIACVC